jgi:hypothetical protein
MSKTIYFVSMQRFSLNRKRICSQSNGTSLRYIIAFVRFYLSDYSPALFWETGLRSEDKDIPRPYGTRIYITVSQEPATVFSPKLVKYNT